MTEKRESYSLDASANDTGRQSSPIEADGPVSSPSGVREEAKRWPTSVAEFDEMFDNGEDIDHLIDWSKAEPVNAPRRVNVDFPLWMVKRLDAQARRRGVTRQALIKMWLADRLEAAG